jgi:hypothetical protein
MPFDFDAATDAALTPKAAPPVAAPPAPATYDFDAHLEAGTKGPLKASDAALATRPATPQGYGAFLAQGLRHGAESVVDAVLNVGPALLNYEHRRMTGTDESPWGQRGISLRRADEAIMPALPAPSPSEAVVEKAGEIGGQTAALAAGGELVGGLGEVGQAAKMVTGPLTAGNIGIGTAAGAAGDIAANQTLIPIDEKWKPLVATIAGTVGGVGAASPSLAYQGGRAAGAAIAEALSPRARVARELQSQVSDPAAAAAALRGADETLPLTSGQIVPELATAERNTARASQENTQQFNLFAQKQREAQQAYLEATQKFASGENASPQDVARYFRDFRDSANEAHAANVAMLGSQAKEAVAGAEPRPGMETPEAVGAGIREPAVAHDTARDQAINDMYNALGDRVQIPAGPITEASRRLQAEIATTPETKLTPREKELHGVIDNYGSTMPLKNVRSLSSALSDAIAEARASNNLQAAGRLTQLRGAVESSLDQAVANEVAHNPEALDRIQKIAQAHYDRTTTEVGQGSAGGGQEGNGRDTGPGQAENIGTGGTAGAPTGGLRTTPAGASVSQGPGAQAPGAAGTYISPRSSTGKEARFGGEVTQPRVPSPERRKIQFAPVKDGAGSTVNGTTTLVDPVFKGVMIDGKPVTKYLNIHEATEQKIVNESGARTPEERHAQYDAAHDKATEVEHAALRADGIDPQKYEDLIRSKLHQAEQEGRPSQDPRLDLYPYPAKQRETKARVAGHQQTLDTAAQNKARADMIAEQANRQATSQAAKDYKAAREATKSLKASQEKPIIEWGIGKNPRGRFEQPEAALPEKLWKAGDLGGTTIRDYLAHGGTTQAAEDAAALSFGKRAFNADGTLNPDKAQKWMGDHESALREMPTSTQVKFSKAESAQRAFREASVRAKNAHDEFEKSEFGKVAGIESDQGVVDHVKGLINGKDASTKIGKLADAVRGNADATHGLKRAILESMFGEADSFAENNAFTTQAKQVGIRFENNIPGMKKIFSDEEIGKIRALINHQRKINAAAINSKLPGGSDTAQNLSGIRGVVSRMKGLMGETDPALMGVLMGESIGHSLSGPGAGFAIGKVLHAVQKMGIETANALRVEAALNPKLAAELLERPTTSTQAKYRLENIAKTLSNIGGAALRAGARQL